MEKSKNITAEQALLYHRHGLVYHVEKKEIFKLHAWRSNKSTVSVAGLIRSEGKMKLILNDLTYANQWVITNGETESLLRDARLAE